MLSSAPITAPTPPTAAQPAERELLVYHVSPDAGRSATVRTALLPASGVLRSDLVHLLRPALHWEPGEQLTRVARERRALLDEERRVVTAVVEPRGDGTFRYHPATDQFRYLNVFFHAARAAEFFAAKGVPAGDPVRVMLNVASSFTRPFANVYGRFVVLRSWSADSGWEADDRTLRDPAKDATLIIHETMHCLLSRLVKKHNPALAHGSSFQAQSFREGMCDYFAAAISGSPIIAAYAARDTRFTPRDLRTAASGDPDDPHTPGHALASRLWLRRQERIEHADAFDQQVIGTVREIARDPRSTFHASSMLAERLS